MATNITFQDIFNSYYILYRGDSTVPDTTDPEWLTAVSLANNAIRSWGNDNAVEWKELWTTNRTFTPTATLTSGTITYTAPTDMKKPGSSLRITGPSASGSFTIPVVDEKQVGLLAGGSMFAYFTGNPNVGYTLIIPGMATTLFGPQYTGWALDYDYYKNPATMSLATTATAAQQAFVPEMYDTEYMVHYMLANRYRASRNWPAYQTAMRDAQNSLKQMEQANALEVGDNSWNIWDNDTSGVFGS